MKSKIGRLRIGHIMVDAEFVKNSLAQAAEMNGCYMPAEQKIYIDDTLDGVRLQHVLWHEIIHAFWDVYGWPDSIDQEEACKLIAPAITAFIAQNQRFFEQYLA